MGRVIIVGGGIVGLSCAFFANREGWEVTVLDGLGSHRAASIGNAGVLAVADSVPVGTPGTIAAVPRMLLSRDSPLRIRPAYLLRILPWLTRMAVASRPARVEQISIALAGLLASAVEAHKTLASAVGCSERLRASGYLKLFETDESLEAAAPDRRLVDARGVPSRLLGAAEITKMEPAIAPIFKHGIFYPDCLQVDDPQSYVERLRQHLVAEGVEIMSALAGNFERTGDRVTGVVTTSGVVKGDAFVIASGAWSGPLARRLGVTVPLDTERGYHMMLTLPACRTLQTPFLWSERSIVMSPMRGMVRVTSGVEFAGLHAPADFSNVLKHLPHVQRAIPGIATEADSLWLGFRPSMPDSMPVIGAVPGLKNAFLGFGHGHLGLTLGPVTGMVLAQGLTGDARSAQLKPFSAGRFMSGAH